MTNITRRGALALLAGAVAVRPTAAQSIPPPTGGRLQTIIDLVPSETREREAAGNAQTVWLPDWTPQGDAYSANGQSLHWQFGLAQVAFARWLLIWNPKGDPFNGVRLRHDTYGARPRTVLGEVTGSRHVGPRCDGVIITDLLNRVRADGDWGYVMQFTRGNPVVFASRLEIVWETSHE